MLLRLLIAEGPKHPDLTAYYYEHVVSVGLASLKELIRKGIDEGDFHETVLDEFPQLLVSPVLFCVMYSTVFERHEPLDTDRLLENHVELIISTLKNKQPMAGAS